MAMKKLNLFVGIGLLFLLLASACSEKEEVVSDEKVRVLFSVDEFESMNDSRTSVDPSNDYAITWAAGDVIGIFPREGYQEPFVIPADQVGNSKAEFDGGYWALKNGLEYNAYYPFDKANFESAEMKTQIPVSYIGQEQNGTTCGIGSFDYTYSDWKTASNGAVSFNFHHIGSFVILTLPIPVTTTYTAFTLEAGSAVIPMKGTYDLTASTPEFVADASSYVKSVSVKLNEFEGTANSNSTIYMMLPPVDLSSETLTLTLEAADGGTCVYSVAGPALEKGKKAELVGTPISSTVAGTTQEWLVNNGIIPEDEYYEVAETTAGKLSSAKLNNAPGKLSNYVQSAKGFVFL